MRKKKSKPLEQIKLLIYDDSEDDLFTMKRSICHQHKEYDVYTANSEERFNHCVAQKNYDLLLLDNRLGEINGLEFMQHLRQKGFQTPIIVITGNDSETVAKKVMDGGAYDYVVKQSHWFSLNLKLGFFKKQFFIENELRRLNSEMESEIKNQTKGFRIAKEIADKANKTKSVFLSNMSHELRTPMHAILSFADFGLKKIDSASREKLIKYFLTIKESGERTLTLLNNLLVIANLESGDLKLKIGEHDLYTLVMNALSGFRVKALKKDIQIKIEGLKQPSLVAIDKEKISQVFFHLLDNAIEYSYEKGVVRLIFEETITKGSKITKISICDEGIGIPTEELTRVFEKFEQSSKTNTGVGGTGLGLSICREIIHMHGGQIRAKPNSPQGIVMTFYLPRVKTK